MIIFLGQQSNKHTTFRKNDIQAELCPNKEISFFSKFTIVDSLPVNNHVHSRCHYAISSEKKNSPSPDDSRNGSERSSILSEFPRRKNFANDDEWRQCVYYTLLRMSNTDSLDRTISSASTAAILKLAMTSRKQRVTPFFSLELIGDG